MKLLGRRAFLAATGLSAAVLPLLPRDSRAQSSGARRLVAVAVPNGHTDKFLPLGGETDFSFNADPDSPLAPLGRHREKLLILGGLWLKNGWDTTYVVPNNDARMFSPGSIGGHAATSMLLTGAIGAEGPPQFGGWEMTAGGPSVDTYIAEHQPGTEGVRFKPLALRATRRNTASAYVSFKGAPLTPKVQNTTGLYDDPRQLFSDVFGDGAALGQEQLQAVIAGKRHILDHTVGHLQAMHQHFGTENKLRIEAHLEAVRRAAESLGAVTSCQAPPAPTADVDYLTADHNINYPAIVKVGIDLSVVALACDLTRSVSHLWNDGANDNVSFRWLADRNSGFDGVAPDGQLGGGQIRSHHNIAHHDSGELKNYSDQWFVEQYAYLLDRLSETPGADGRPLIETSVALYCNMQRTGGGHQTQDIFWLLGGNFDGYFRTGRYLRWAGGQQGQSIPHNQVLVSLINGSGCAPLEYFGEQQYGGELGALKA
jgi:hypothetical protein